jgi:hypothetical protein
MDLASIIIHGLGDLSSIYLVEIDRGYVGYKKIELRSPRPWIIIEAKSIREAVEKLEATNWSGFSKEPIVHITIEGSVSRVEKDRLISLLNTLRSEGKILYYRGPLISSGKTDLLEVPPKDSIEEVPTVDIEAIVKSLFRDSDVSSFIIDLVNGSIDEDTIVKTLTENKNIAAKIYSRFSRGRRLDDY